MFDCYFSHLEDAFLNIITFSALNPQNPHIWTLCEAMALQYQPRAHMAALFDLQ